MEESDRLSRRERARLTRLETAIYGLTPGLIESELDMLGRELSRNALDQTNRRLIEKLLGAVQSLTIASCSIKELCLLIQILSLAQVQEVGPEVSAAIIGNVEREIARKLPEGITSGQLVPEDLRDLEEIVVEAVKSNGDVLIEYLSNMSAGEARLTFVRRLEGFASVVFFRPLALSRLLGLLESLQFAISNIYEAEDLLYLLGAAVNYSPIAENERGEVMARVANFAERILRLYPSDEVICEAESALRQEIKAKN